MNNQNEMTSEQLERFAKLYSRCQELNPVFALAREGLRLREAKQTGSNEMAITVCDLNDQLSVLTAELDSLRKDKERLAEAIVIANRLIPKCSDQSNYTRFQEICSEVKFENFCTAIDSAMRKDGGK